MGPGRGFSKKTTDHDTVVLDAPASGHGVAMLRSPRTFSDIAAGGPIRKQAEKVWDLLRDSSRCAIVAVALPAELPVAETIELDEWTHEVLGRGLDLVVANRCEPASFSSAELKKIAGAASDGVLPEGAHQLAVAASERHSEQAELLEVLADGVDCDIVTLAAEPADTRPLDLVSKLSADLLAATTA
jgi:anion-transporting  ArsA/GET3 family ATPase